MYSERIKALAEEIEQDDIVLDIGCDHGYLCLYIKENNLCKEVFASDISENALSSARKNFKKYNYDIKSFVSDGFNNVDVSFNTAVIAGMGTSTILKILNNKKNPDKLIVSSHNEHYKLRKNLNELGYKILKEKIVYENNHYYVILTLKKGNQKLTENELKFGISKDNEYYNYLLSKRKELIKRVPFTKKIKLYHECFVLKGLIEKK